MSAAPLTAGPDNPGKLPGNPMHPTSLRNPIGKHTPRTSVSAIKPVESAILKQKANPEDVIDKATNGGSLPPPEVLRQDSLPPSPPSSVPLNGNIIGTALTCDPGICMQESGNGTNAGECLHGTEVIGIDDDDDSLSISPLEEALKDPLVKSIIDTGSKKTSRPIKQISAKTVVSALDYHYSNPLPDVDTVFPWLHGLNPKNIGQRIFLNPKHRGEIPPSCNISMLHDILDEVDDLMLEPPTGVRGLCIVKVGDTINEFGDLVGTIVPSDLLCPSQSSAETDWDEFSFDTTVFNGEVCQSHTNGKDDYNHNNNNNNNNNNTNNDKRNDNNNDNNDDYDDYNDRTDSCDLDDDNETPYIGKFLFIDPKDGISLRNFQIQVAKWATISDIIVYCPDESEISNAIKIANLISKAQQEQKRMHPHLSLYHTFINVDSISTFLNIAPHVVSTPPKSFGCDREELQLKNWDSNFLFHERVEMSMMSSASPLGEVSLTQNCVWVGNTIDFETYIDQYHSFTTNNKNNNNSNALVDDANLQYRNWVTFVECFEGAQLPSVSILNQYLEEVQGIIEGKVTDKELTPLSIQFPSSGSLALSAYQKEDVLSLLTLCKLLYLRTRVTYHGLPAGVLIYCNDGYTETTLLTLAYISYYTGVRISQATLDLHKKYNRPFFCFAVDLIILSEIEQVLLTYSVANQTRDFLRQPLYMFSKEELELIDKKNTLQNEKWFAKIDGCLPSRILPHLYLGSLVHAHNPEMLSKVGIKRVLSVGEKLQWVDYDRPIVGDINNVFESPCSEISKVMYMDNIQDDGVDALTTSLSDCLAFLDEAYHRGEPTLVHCRVGVSRSATVCIAEVMKRLAVGLPRAYLFVRVRRLNVIIQPNLRFMYELVKWEELHRNTGDGWLREVDWPILCREIAAMNKVYIG